MWSRPMDREELVLPTPTTRMEATIRTSWSTYLTDLTMPRRRTSLATIRKPSRNLRLRSRCPPRRRTSIIRAWPRSWIIYSTESTWMYAKRSGRSRKLFLWLEGSRTWILRKMICSRKLELDCKIRIRAKLKSRLTIATTTRRLRNGSARSARTTYQSSIYSSMIWVVRSLASRRSSMRTNSCLISKVTSNLEFKCLVTRIKMLSRS